MVHRITGAQPMASLSSSRKRKRRYVYRPKCSVVCEWHSSKREANLLKIISPILPGVFFQASDFV